MSRPQRGWKPITMTISEEAANALRTFAKDNKNYKYMGTLVDQLLKAELIPLDHDIVFKINKIDMKRLLVYELYWAAARLDPKGKLELARAVRRHCDEPIEPVLREMRGTWTQTGIPMDRQAALFDFLVNTDKVIACLSKTFGKESIKRWLNT